MKDPQKRLAFQSTALALLMASLLLIFLLLFANVQYASNDDTSIMRAFIGYETGTPARFHIYIHGLLAQPLGWLSTAFPGLPWFTYLQLALLWLSCAVMAKSIMRCFARHEQPLWLGAAFAAVFLLVFCARYIARITFTQTAALLGGAAVLNMLSIPHDRGAKPVIAGMAGSLALVALCYALRQITALPVLAFCGLAFLLIAWQEYLIPRRSFRPMFLSLAMVAVVMGALVGLREAELAHNDVGDYLAWQEANTAAMDYYGLANVPQEARDLAGLSNAEIALAQNWCFLDSDLSIEAFETMNAYMAARDTSTLSQRLQNGWKLLAEEAKYSPVDIRCFALGLLAAVLGLAGACLRKRWRDAGAILCTLAGVALIVTYLAAEGRVPVRALLMAVLPASAILFAVLPGCLPRRLARAGCALCAALCVWCLAGAWAEWFPARSEDEIDPLSLMPALEEYALYEPESLFLYDLDIALADVGAFPDYSEGVPHNVTFWGGWGMRSPENIRLFENYGMDLLNFDPEALLRGDIYFVSNHVDPPPMPILRWLREEISPNVECEIWSEYDGIYVFNFCLYE